ncbi:CheW protein [Caldalkalibacillus thermarum TA2.A1]|uniref:Chemotaxis protein CheW n=1 Tax=Caldalkalibacillus thermarum (strain TA2.A1) TaxID=986075 RepID=F5L7Z4_CALTT|nr:chemotaxis protein CheW [Caldalkalibacillus thermarum]EGL82502.1 CheW protein [Caldalkalibacillus thermarum TA2.A1]QZT33002.1 chemotaxis protein CheW [Caldalkalibacillus thermarum TA2.A1]
MQNEQVKLEEKKVVVFRLDNEEYAIEVEQVRSIEPLQPITRVPHTPPFVKGVINLRGVVTPVIDLRRRFNLDETDDTSTTRIIIVVAGEMEAGLIVDAANDVINIPVDGIEPPPEVVGGVMADYVRGVVRLENRLLTLLNLEHVLSHHNQTNKIEETS